MADFMPLLCSFRKTISNMDSFLHGFTGETPPFFRQLFTYQSMMWSHHACVPNPQRSQVKECPPGWHFESSPTPLLDMANFRKTLGSQGGCLEFLNTSKKVSDLVGG